LIDSLPFAAKRPPFRCLEKRSDKGNGKGKKRWKSRKREEGKELENITNINSWLRLC